MTPRNSPYVADEDSVDPELNQITNRIIGAAIEVHKELGPGQLEAIYQKAIEIEFRLRGIRYERQIPFVVSYKGEKIGEGQIDLLVEDKIVVDLKAIDSIGPTQLKQMIWYLAALDKPLGLILNFNAGILANGIRRVAGRPRAKS